jgi:hypothetical protein
VGARLRLRLTPAGEEASEVGADVLIVRPLRKLEWETRLLAPGVLDHEQIFRVVPAGTNRFRIVQEARFEGILAPFARLDDDRRGLVAMIRALARRAGTYQSSSE